SYAYPQSFLLEGARAVVFGGEVQAPEPVEGDPSAARPAVEYATVTFVDLADPTAPVVTDRARIEGSLVAARRVDGAVRIVTASTMSDLPLVLPTNPNSVPVALEQNRLAVAG
ncbi:MAG: beta-propeller domain-containing protein, partial [Microthrixaceae bacterium]|nr:beta-propeller domain-containing protein [Microthrixaceae bacterium]